MIQQKIGTEKKTLLTGKVMFCAIIFMFSILALWPVLVREGWPYNHEWLSWRSRLMCYIYHFRQGDFMPLWSSAEANGLGSPLPLYYHKLFYYFFAIVYFIFQNVKTALIVCLATINFIGVLGLYKALVKANIDKVIALVISISLLFQYYTITDWFVRGAFSEYLAMMLSTWFFYWVFNVLLYKKHSSFIGTLLGLIYLSHSIIAYYLIFAIVIVQLFDFYYNKTRFKTVFIYYLKAATIFMVIIGIFNFPIIITSKYYDPSYIKFDINYFYQDIILYIYDHKYVWNKTWEGYSVQFNPVTIIFVILIIVVSVVYYKKQNSFANDLSFRPVFIIFLFYLLLQFRFSNFFYNSVPGADYIQFPWRLISFMQIGLLILMALYLNDLKNIANFKWLSIFYFAGIVVCYPLFSRTEETWQWFPKDQLEAQINEGVYGVGEYMPVVKGFDKPDASYFSNLASLGIQKTSSLTIIEPYAENKNPEKVELKYHVNCKSEDTVILPINYSGLENAYKYNNGQMTKIKAYRIDTDPRVRIDLPKGEYHLFVRLASIKNFF